MIDPLPLTRDGATPFEALLLSAGRSDAVTSQSRARIHFGLGLGGGALAATAIATSLKATAVKSAILSTGSAALVGAVGAAALLFSVNGFLRARALDSAAQSQQPVVAAPRVAPAPPPPLEMVPAVPPQPIADTIEPKPAVTKSNAREVAGSAAPAASLTHELNAIEGARRALSRRDHALALRLLDGYAARFPQQSLRSEATLLRIETLAASGSVDAAHQLGKSFLAKHPNGPYARRVRSLLAEPAAVNHER